MGSSSSKFKKYLQHGDEFAAMQVFQSSPELRRNLDPNLSYGDSHQHNTALHYAAKHGMKHLLRTFLNDLGGNPNKKNGSNESSLHAACQLGQTKSFSAQERRAACVALLLQWRGVELNSGGRERVDLQAQDSKGNTALHCAAMSGLKRCVELLLAHGSPLFTENADKLTPCDMAMRSNHHDIAQLLESRMVFADSMDTVNEAELLGDGGGQEEVYSGLRTQDLQEAKDQLLVETSDMLHIPLFTAEALLRDNEWSREALLEKWMKDPVQCCQLAGVQPPTSALQHLDSHPGSGVGTPALVPGAHQLPGSDVVCEICMLAMPSWDQPVAMTCGHRFCTSCWESYLTVKIQDGDAHHILCPAFQCHILVPVELIERLVSPDMARRYLQFDIKAFVESNRSIKWCPMPGCGRAVRLPETEQLVQSHGLVPKLPGLPATSHAVDCGNGHFFCWECLGEAHAPCGCAQWQQWQKKISEVKPEELKASCVETEDAANCLWLVTNSKPCPNCKSPIQKNEGCNHMKCSKCKFDFCWVCLENWKKHSSATGGYFRCNRFEAASRADERQGVLISEAALRSRHVHELNRFLHFYTRFRNHEHSQRLEEPLLTSARQKMELLASSLGPRLAPGQSSTPNSVPARPNGEAAERGTRFVEDAVRELLKARRVLCGSYVYGYYLEDNGYNKTIFEFMQNELEEVTEKLSEQVARPYLRTPRSLIIQTTALARRKRHEFVRAVAKGLIPPETPPTLRKVRKRRDPAEDEQMSHAIAASLKDLDPNNPWVKDAQGRHTNLSALYDWPDFDSDEEESEVSRALAVSLLGECARPGCGRARARNPRTAQVHEYCSLRCSQAARLAPDDLYRVNVTSDYNMDLVIALEMSRLQMIEDEMKKRQRNGEGSGENCGGGEGSGDSKDSCRDRQNVPELLTPDDPPSDSQNDFQNQEVSGDEQLALAIRLSLQERAAADRTVDCFLKSLAGRHLDLSGLSPKSGEGDDALSPDVLGEGVGVMEDGHFEIGDLHENGRFGMGDDGDVGNGMGGRGLALRRARSTGDLRCAAPPDEPRYHLDSDHSSQHDEKPEEVARRRLAAPAHTLQHHRPPAPLPTANTPADTVLDPALYFGGQSSVEDTTTTSDSLNADLEVCGILGTTTEDDEDDEILPPHPPPLPALPLAPARTTPAASAAPVAPRATPAPADSLLEARRRAFHAGGGGGNVGSSNIGGGTGTGVSTAANGLRIRICKSPSSAGGANSRQLETDSSNEYESETGIPKSPTLFISGVSISRTPEPRSPALAAAAAAAAAAAVAGRQSQSSSLTVPPPPPTAAPGTAGPGPPPSGTSAPTTPAPAPASSPAARASPEPPPPPDQQAMEAAESSTPPTPSSPPPRSPSATAAAAAAAAKSKSASEPEREREMFRFPKSSTDGALSSVLLVQESNLSSDDFHEALFLPERSPARGGGGSSGAGSRRRKRSKKERHKDKEVGQAKAAAAAAAAAAAKEASSAL